MPPPVPRAGGSGSTARRAGANRHRGRPTPAPIDTNPLRPNKNWPRPAGTRPGMLRQTKIPQNHFTRLSASPPALLVARPPHRERHDGKHIPRGHPDVREANENHTSSGQAAVSGPTGSIQGSEERKPIGLTGSNFFPIDPGEHRETTNDGVPYIPPLRRHANFLRLASRYVVPAIGRPEGPRLVFDIETDGLLEAATRIHCIVVADLDSNRVDEFGPDQIDAGLARLSEATYLTGHNIVGFDLAVLHRLHGWAPAPTVTVVDTLITGRLVLANIARPGRPGRRNGGSEARQAARPPQPQSMGRSGSESPKSAPISRLAEWTPELQERCVGDTRLTKGAVAVPAAGRSAGGSTRA